MRITRIVIDSFGALTKWHSPELTENMTLVSGQNEAGKSTIMEFVRSTMFPVRSFKYPAAAKTDSGSIEIVMDNGDRRTLIREQKKVSEIDGKRTVSEEFRNIDSDTYRSLYALDLEQLTNSKVISSGEFRNKFLTVPGGEKVPQVSAEIEDRLGQLMNKEKMTDSKIIGRNLKALKNINAMIAEIEKNDENYDALVAERDNLKKKVDENKNLIKINRNNSERNKILMSQSENVDRLNELMEDRLLLEKSRNIPLESKEEFDNLKRDITKLTTDLEESKCTETMKGADPKSVLRRKESIEFLWDERSRYIENAKNRDDLKEEIEFTNDNIESMSKKIGWTVEDARKVKTGRRISDRAEAEMNGKRRQAGNAGGKNMMIARAVLVAVGIIMAAVGALLFMNNIVMLAVMAAIGIILAGAGILLPKIINKTSPVTETSETADRSEWNKWIASEGYPAGITPEKACVLATKLESLINVADRRDSDTEKLNRLLKDTTIYENEVKPLTNALGIEHTTFEDDVLTLHKMLSASEKMSAEIEQHEGLENELTEKTSAMRRFLKKYGTEEDFLDAYEGRLILDKLDKEIETLTASIETSAGLSIKELVAYYENDGNAIDIEDCEDNTEEFNRRIGEINSQLKNIIDDDTLSSLLTEKCNCETNLDKAIREWAVYNIANAIITDSCNHFYTDLQPSVVKTANRYLDMMTDGKYQLDNDPRNNEISIRDSVTKKTSTQWSSGLGDQVYLSMKMALVKEMGAEKLPLILDDVLVRFDSVRKQGACKAIYEFSKDHQVIMFTCDGSLYNNFALEGKINDVKLSKMM